MFEISPLLLDFLSTGVRVHKCFRVFICGANRPGEKFRNLPELSNMKPSSQNTGIIVICINTITIMTLIVLSVGTAIGG